MTVEKTRSGGCPYAIVATSQAKNNDYLTKIYMTTINFLMEEEIPYQIDEQLNYGSTEWKITVNSESGASKATNYLMKHHTYLDARCKKVGLFVTPKAEDVKMRQYAICIGARPPAPSDLTSCKDVYLQQFLPDHSLPLTRLIHAVATVAGTALAIYGAYSGNWLYIPLGILVIFEAGVHSHLFVEKNIPSSQHLLQVAYSDFRITAQTFLNPITEGMQRDLQEAGMSEKPSSFNNCPYAIVAVSQAKNNDYLKKIYKITVKFLDSKGISHTREAWSLKKGDTEWKITLDSESKASEAALYLMKQHSYVEARYRKVELFVIPKTDDAKKRPHAVCIGTRPPTPNDLQSCEDVYFQQYLPDHSLPLTRLIHTVATVAGTALAVYGACSGNWPCIPIGILAIYEAGFHSHMFVEKNIPSSGKYPLQSVYSDLRVTAQTLLDPFTKGMQKDLAKAGIVPATDEEKKESAARESKEEKEPAVHKSKAAIPFFDFLGF